MCMHTIPYSTKLAELKVFETLKLFGAFLTFLFMTVLNARNFMQLKFVRNLETFFPSQVKIFKKSQLLRLCVCSSRQKNSGVDGTVVGVVFVLKANTLILFYYVSALTPCAQNLKQPVERYAQDTFISGGVQRPVEVEP